LALRLLPGEIAFSEQSLTHVRDSYLMSTPIILARFQPEPSPRTCAPRGG
jgi:hypothetical protein